MSEIHPSNIILENCSSISKFRPAKKRECEERNRQRLEKIGNVGITDCKSKCMGWFPGNFTLAAGCESSCNAGEEILSQCDYLENYVGDQATIAYYGIDCDLESGSGSALMAGRKADQQKYLIVAVVIVVALFLMWLIFM